MAIKKRTKLSREDLIAKYELQPEGLRQEVVEVVEEHGYFGFFATGGKIIFQEFFGQNFTLNFEFI